MGCNLVQIYTSLIYRGPAVVSNILSELSLLIKKDGYSNITQLVGKKLKMSKPTELINLSEISKFYDVFFIDLWGVVHNGVKLFNDTIDVLQNLKKEKRKFFF